MATPRYRHRHPTPAAALIWARRHPNTARARPNLTRARPNMARHLLEVRERLLEDSLLALPAEGLEGAPAREGGRVGLGSCERAAVAQVRREVGAGVRALGRVLAGRPCKPPRRTHRARLMIGDAPSALQSQTHPPAARELPFNRVPQREPTPALTWATTANGHTRSCANGRGFESRRRGVRPAVCAIGIVVSNSHASSSTARYVSSSIRIATFRLAAACGRARARAQQANAKATAWRQQPHRIGSVRDARVRVMPRPRSVTHARSPPVPVSVASLGGL
eukprot:7385271-Prymnesium_polylepis.1